MKETIGFLPQDLPILVEIEIDEIPQDSAQLRKEFAEIEHKEEILGGTPRLFIDKLRLRLQIHLAESQTFQKALEGTLGETFAEVLRFENMLGWDPGQTYKYLALYEIQARKEKPDIDPVKAQILALGTEADRLDSVAYQRRRKGKDPESMPRIIEFLKTYADILQRNNKLHPLKVQIQLLNDHASNIWQEVLKRKESGQKPDPRLYSLKTMVANYAIFLEEITSLTPI